MYNDEAKHTMEHLNLHEVKTEAAAIPETKIVSAYGLRKCPKLVEQISGDNLEVRVNALSVLCDELANPYSVALTVKAGVIPVLASMVTDPDYTTRERASRALSIAAKDANGLSAILLDAVIRDILLGRNDPSDEVRLNVYQCLLNVTKTHEGVVACTDCGTTEAFVEALEKDEESMKPTLLQAIHNIAGSEQGLVNALNAGVVRVLIHLLHSTSDTTRADSARTLAFVCFDERGKNDALEYGAVPALFRLVSAASQPTSVISQALLALMSITSSDEGKRQSNDREGISAIVNLLSDNDRVVKLNALKVISNISVFPPIRKQLISDPLCLSILNRMVASGDKLLERHAKVALDAVNWKA